MARWVVSVQLLAVACGGASASGSFTPGPMPRGGAWTGVYFSDWGRMELSQTGDTVVGTFQSEVKRGRLSGNVNGNVLRFTWQQEDNTIHGRPRTVSGAGVFQYTVDGSGEHKLSGSWGYDAAVEGGGLWNAVRGRGRPGTPRRPTSEDQYQVQGGAEDESTGTSTQEPAANPDALEDL